MDYWRRPAVKTQDFDLKNVISCPVGSFTYFCRGLRNVPELWRSGCDWKRGRRGRGRASSVGGGVKERIDGHKVLRLHRQKLAILLPKKDQSKSSKPREHGVLVTPKMTGPTKERWQRNGAPSTTGSTAGGPLHVTVTTVRSRKINDGERRGARTTEPT